MRLFGFYITRESLVLSRREEIVNLRGLFLHFQELHMTSMQDIKDALAKLASDAAAEKSAVAALTAAFKDQVAGLQSQVAAGTPVTSTDLDSILSQISGIDEAVKSISVVTPEAAATAATTVDAATAAS